MPDYELKRINALTEATSIGDEDVFAIDGANGTKKIKWSTLDGKVSDKVKADMADGVAGSADQLIASTGKTDKVPYIYRASEAIGDRAFDTLVGGSVGWNQLVKIPSSDISKTENGVTITDNRDGSYTVSAPSPGATANTYLAMSNTGILAIAGHKYLYFGTPKGGGSGTYYSYAIGVGSINISDDYGDGVIGVGIEEGAVSIVCVYVKSGTVISTPIVFRPQFFDLTLALGSTIADYVYSLESSQTGDGVAWLKANGFFTADYYAYDAGSMQSVTGVSAHKLYDAEDNVIGNYPLDSTWTGRGILKMDADHKLYFDGDVYASNGIVTRHFAERDYQEGDASDGSTMITNGTKTVYKLTTPTKEQATPFTSPQICDPNGSEEYVTTGIVPVGHETFYPTDLKASLEVIADTPTSDGTYALQCTVSGGAPTFSWESA